MLYQVLNRFCRINSSSDNMLLFVMVPDHVSAQKRLQAPALSRRCDSPVCSWYLAYALSLRNLEGMMAERGIIVAHSTLHRWVIRLVPLLDKALRRHKRPVGRRWRMDETYIKIRGQWKYLYRAVDTAGDERGDTPSERPTVCGGAPIRMNPRERTTSER